MAFDKELLEFLVCPQCKGDLTLAKPEDGLVCNTCRLKFPIRDGIPIMLMDEAQDLDKATGSNQPL
jgi:uncharacterized protein YbaR (Trm112 family)